MTKNVFVFEKLCLYLGKKFVLESCCFVLENCSSIATLFYINRNNKMYVRIYFDEMLKQTIKQLPQYTNIESILGKNNTNNTF